MNISLKLKYIFGAVALLLLIFLSAILYWLYNNTALFTDKISTEDLKQNNLNSVNDFELTSIDIGNKTLNIPNEPFVMPEGVVEVEIDSDTKKLPTSRTKKTELEVFLKSNQPRSN